MSLLMKALEKAAQDRTKTTTDKQPATTATHGTSTLSLEPIASAATITTTPAPRFEPTISAPAADGARQESPKTGAPETSNPATRSAGRSNEQTRAAVLLNTQSSARPAGAGIVAWVSTHPVHFTAALAGALAVGYAVYLYLQIAHPGLFLRKPVAQTQPVATTTAPPSPPLTLTRADIARRIAAHSRAIGFQQHARYSGNARTGVAAGQRASRQTSAHGRCACRCYYSSNSRNAKSHRRQSRR